MFALNLFIFSFDMSFNYLLLDGVLAISIQILVPTRSDAHEKRHEFFFNGTLKPLFYFEIGVF